MKSHATARFRKALDGLSERVRREAREAYTLFRQNPRHPSLHFKQIHPTKPIYSARVSLDLTEDALLTLLEKALREGVFSEQFLAKLRAMLQNS